MRSLPEMLAAAGGDLKVALGLLDAAPPRGRPQPHPAAAHHDARRTGGATPATGCPRCTRWSAPRHELIGELAHASVPDLKEAEGGLRDATVLKALVATWLVDVPHVDLERSPAWRCSTSATPLHDVAGRRHRPGRARDCGASWPTGLGLPDARAAQAHVRELGRRITHLSRLTWRRVDAVLAPARAARGRADPRSTPLAPGVALSARRGGAGRGARGRPSDPLLLLRAAAEAAERDVVLAPATAARLVRDGAPLPEPWPRRGPPAAGAAARRRVAGCSAVWETLEETGALARILPEWERIRLLPHASADPPVHRRPARRRDLHRGLRADPPRRAAPTCSWSPRCCTTSARAA